jgi:hypothetical protein
MTVRVGVNGFGRIGHSGLVVVGTGWRRPGGGRPGLSEPDPGPPVAVPGRPCLLTPARRGSRPAWSPGRDALAVAARVTG